MQGLHVPSLIIVRLLINQKMLLYGCCCCCRWRGVGRAEPCYSAALEERLFSSPWMCHEGCGPRDGASVEPSEIGAGGSFPCLRRLDLSL